ncbi:hypothetical protein GCM10025876_06620 [Demequina litorisediminis]|uniref:Uncharacterized protein n=1 Tax=Demequina litorisediminis TaxID=1849022 RepID=A0ABQ6ICK9_9MICO|nr:hypothetical protein GCM10025876_06620 [Demequina litorisediminis]
MQAARLIHRDLPLARERVGVTRQRLRSEEPVGINMGADQGIGLDGGIGAALAEPQRERMAPVLRRAVDHRPLVHPKTAQERFAPRGRHKQATDVRHGLAAFGEEAVGVQGS